MKKAWIKIYQQIFQEFVDSGLSESEAKKQASADVENQIADHGDNLYNLQKDRELG